jgi:hypothetical protein
MYKYIITVAPLSLSSWVFRPADGGARFEAVTARHIEAKEATGTDFLTNGSENKCPVWYANTEEVAIQVSRHLAAKCPGQQVYISELKHVATAKVPAISMAVFSDRGLVPA